MVVKGHPVVEEERIGGCQAEQEGGDRLLPPVYAVRSACIRVRKAAADKESKAGEGYHADRDRHERMHAEDGAEKHEQEPGQQRAGHGQQSVGRRRWYVCLLRTVHWLLTRRARLRIHGCAYPVVCWSRFQVALLSERITGLRIAVPVTAAKPAQAFHVPAQHPCCRFHGTLSRGAGGPANSAGYIYNQDAGPRQPLPRCIRLPASGRTGMKGRYDRSGE